VSLTDTILLPATTIRGMLRIIRILLSANPLSSARSFGLTLPRA